MDLSDFYKFEKILNKHIKNFKKSIYLIINENKLLL